MEQRGGRVWPNTATVFLGGDSGVRQHAGQAKLTSFRLPGKSDATCLFWFRQVVEVFHRRANFGKINRLPGGVITL